jgi:hypothetical protein
MNQTKRISAAAITPLNHQSHSTPLLSGAAAAAAAVVVVVPVVLCQ